MNTLKLNPHKIDVAAFARDQLSLQGTWSIAQLSRLHDYFASDVALDDIPPVEWHVTGRIQPTREGSHEIWLDLHLQAALPLRCQRCLQAVQEAIVLDRSTRFVKDEQVAAQLDQNLEEDILALTPTFDFCGWMEEEIILALPLVPKHESCSTPTALGADEAPCLDDLSIQESIEPVASHATDTASTETEASISKKNPFAILAELKKRGPMQ